MLSTSIIPASSPLPQLSSHFRILNHWTKEKIVSCLPFNSTPVHTNSKENCTLGDPLLQLPHAPALPACPPTWGAAGTE